MMRSEVTRDSVATLAAVGVIAYVFETIGHEALGHGTACLALGGRIEAIAPLWMRCSETSKVITASGPLFNVLAAALLGAALCTGTRLTTFYFLLWFGCAFNALVACGYLMVGGATTFGDWAVLFEPITPPWAWRAAALGLGLAGYLVSLRLLSRLYGRLVAADGFAKAVLLRRLLVPGGAAALVACAAEFAAGQPYAAGFVLPLACTIVPAVTLLSIEAEQRGAKRHQQSVYLKFSAGLMAIAALAGALLVGLGSQSGPLP